MTRPSTGFPFLDTGLDQPGAVLALISRSHLVDFDALTELVTAGRFKAVIDVFPQEPLPADHPIRRAPGVVLSAHRAGSVARDLRLIGRMVVLFRRRKNKPTILIPGEKPPKERAAANLQRTATKAAKKNRKKKAQQRKSGTTKKSEE